ncbi:Gmad2 immunoglobulin-like domain-containing protein [Candidatus Dojkabacteria bacterium]|nr:Gmad2 immunoglobulin-like domain-containing protein [Candidatus Dojkabacteria bacterium]
MKKVLIVLTTLFLIFLLIASVGGVVYMYLKLKDCDEQVESYQAIIESNVSVVADCQADIKDDEENSEDEDTDEDEVCSCYHSSDDDEFFVTRPCENEVLTSSFPITGRGRVFEALFTVRIKNGAGAVLFEENYMTEGGYKDELDAFSDTVSWTPPAASGSGTIEFLTESPKDGSEIVLVSFPVRF